MCSVTLCRPAREYAPQVLEQIVRQILAQADRPVALSFWEVEPSSGSLSRVCRVMEALQAGGKGGQIHIRVLTTGKSLKERHARCLARNGAVVGLLPCGEGAVGAWGADDAFGEPAAAYRQTGVAAQLLAEQQVPFYLAESVTPFLARAVREIYGFFKASGWNYQSYRFDAGWARTAVSEIAEIYRDFLFALFQLWWEDRMGGSAVYILEFDRLAGLLKGVLPSDCYENGRRRSQNLIAPDGRVYPEDDALLSGEALGNIVEMDLPSMEKAYFQQGVTAWKGLEASPACRGCRWAILCGGNWDGWRGERKMLCPAYREFYEFAVPRLLDLLREIGKSFPVAGTA